MLLNHEFGGCSVIPLAGDLEVSTQISLLPYRPLLLHADTYVALLVSHLRKMLKYEKLTFLLSLCLECDFHPCEQIRGFNQCSTLTNFTKSLPCLNMKKQLFTQYNVMCWWQRVTFWGMWISELLHLFLQSLEILKIPHGIWQRQNWSSSMKVHKKLNKSCGLYYGTPTSNIPGGWGTSAASPKSIINLSLSSALYHYVANQLRELFFPVC